jgi:hypothetical protein
VPFRVFPFRFTAQLRAAPQVNIGANGEVYRPQIGVRDVVWPNATLLNAVEANGAAPARARWPSEALLEAQHQAALPARIADFVAREADARTSARGRRPVRG